MRATSELDVQQARTLLYTTQALVPSLQLSLNQTRHALAILLGMPPAELGSMLDSTHSLPVLPASVATGMPADLLRRRPDVRQAELQAAALGAQIGVAQAELYPSFSLFGTLGWSATKKTRSPGARSQRSARAGSWVMMISVAPVSARRSSAWPAGPSMPDREQGRPVGTRAARARGSAPCPSATSYLACRRQRLLGSRTWPWGSSPP